MFEKHRKSFLIGGGFALLLLVWLTFFTVRETEFVLVTQFGQPLYTVADAGLHVKWPFQTANYFDRRLRVYNPRPSEFLTRDKKNLVVESYVAWKIQDPKRFVERWAIPRAPKCACTTSCGRAWRRRSARTIWNPSCPPICRP